MRSTLRFCLFAAILVAGLSTPARAQDEWTVISHSNWPVWMAQGYWDVVSEGQVTIEIADGSGWHAPTREESADLIGAFATGGPQLGDTVQPGDVVGVVIMGVPPLAEPVLVGIIAAVLGAFAGTAFGVWLARKLGRPRPAP